MIEYAVEYEAGKQGTFPATTAVTVGNTHEHPSTSARILRTLPAKSQVILHWERREKGNWFQVSDGQQLGWIHGAYIAADYSSGEGLSACPRLATSTSH